MRRRLAAAVLATAACAGCVLVVTATAATPTGAITGVVTNTSSADIAGASVTVYQDAVVAGSATTADDGTYTVNSLAPGSYTVSFAPPPPTGSAGGSENYLPQNYDAESLSSAGDPVLVSAGETTSAVDASLQPGGAISGVVLDGSGAPVDGVEVEAYDSNGLPMPATQSGADGTWSIDRLPAGVYSIGFTAAGADLNFLPQFLGGGSTIAGAYGVSVSAGATTSGVDIHLQPGGRITGTVTDASSVPIANALVDAYDSGGHIAASATSAADGTYSINGLAGGSYRVGFTTPSGPLTPGPNYLPHFEGGEATLSSAKAISVTAGGTSAGVNAQLAVGGEIKGAATDATSDPIANLDVTAYDSSGDPVAGATTAADGSYTIDGLASGKYRIEFGGAGANGPAPNDAPQFYGGDSLANATAVAVTAGAAASVASAILAPGATVSGYITDAFGAPLGGVTVQAFDAGGNVVGYSAKSALGSGAYTISGLPAGPYRIGFDAGCCSGDYVPQYSDDEPSLASAQVVAVTTGGSEGGIDAAMAAGGHIAGTVTDAAGEPLPGVSVQAIDASGGGVTGTTTGPDGGYALLGLATGTYTVEFETAAGSLPIVPEFFGGSTTQAGASAVAVTAGVTSADIDTQVARVTGSLSGTVTDSAAEPLRGAAVTVYGLDGQAVGPGAISADDGTYEVDGLSPGFYRVRFALSGYAGQFYPNAADGQSIYVAAGQTASGIDAQLQAPAGQQQQQPQPQQQSSPPAQQPAPQPAAGSGGDSDVAVAVAASVGAAGVTGATVSANVSCAAPATGSCTITLTLTSVETSKGSRLLAVSAAKKAKTTRRTVTVGALTVTLAGGQSKTARVTLNAAGRRLLASVHKLPVELVCVTGATRISTETLTLTAAPKQRKKH
jgi:protocatechuate 3,4-dioxygenase beta subunit